MFRKLIIASAFSTNMLRGSELVEFDEITTLQATKLVAEAEVLSSIVGNPATAGFLTQLFGRDIPANKVKFNLTEYVQMLVCEPRVRLKKGQVLSEAEISAVPMKFILCKLIS